jgi:hypothetical protein
VGKDLRMTVPHGVTPSRPMNPRRGPMRVAALRDALGQPGVRTVIILEGINDIGIGELTGAPVTARQLIDAL